MAERRQHRVGAPFGAGAVIGAHLEGDGPLALERVKDEAHGLRLMEQVSWIDSGAAKHDLRPVH